MFTRPLARTFTLNVSAFAALSLVPLGASTPAHATQAIETAVAETSLFVPARVTDAVSTGGLQSLALSVALSAPSKCAYNRGDFYNVTKRAGGSKSQQQKVLRPYLCAIKSAPRGATLWLSYFSLWDEAIARALLDAYARGVHIRVVGWDHFPNKWTRALKRHLGSYNPKKHQASYFKECKGSCTIGGHKGNHHAKFLLVDKTYDTRGTLLMNYAIVSTGNLAGSTASNAWNGTRVIIGNTVIYSAFKEWHNEFLKDRTRMTGKRRYTYQAKQSGAYKLWRTYVHGNPIEQELRQVSCMTGNSKYGVPVKVKRGKKWVTEYRTLIMGNQYIWNNAGLGVARRLASLKEAGCVVRVVLNRFKVSRAVLRVLKRAHVPTWSAGSSYNHYTHCKCWMIDGKFAGENRKFSYIASYNFSKSSDVENAEDVTRWENATATKQLRNQNNLIINAKYKANGRYHQLTRRLF